MSRAKNNVLAIDPGPEQSAWVLYDPEGRCIKECGIEPNAELLELFDTWRHEDPPQLAIEMIASYGMPVGKDVFETVLWIGRFLQAWETYLERRATLVYRREVKLHLCNSMQAKDGNIRQALIDKIGPKGTKAAPGPTYGCKADIWAAIGVAVTYSETREVCAESSVGRLPL